MRPLLVVFALLFSCPAVAAETTPLDFAREYIREIVANEHMRALAEKDMAESNADKMSAIIRASTRITLELRSQIGVLSRMTLGGPFGELPGMIAQLYEKKIELNEQTIAGAEAMASAIAAGPKPDVDYNAFLTEAPKRTAGVMTEYKYPLYSSTLP
jgi:hypothetical protein